jgi:lipid-A-disaccharide synthase
MIITAIAGETSGDALAANVLQNLQQKCNIQLNGIGGPCLKSIGQDQWFDCHELAVRGYVEALPALRRILHIRKYILNQFRQDQSKLYIGIDAADFNLHIEQYAKKSGLPVVHFISPSIWAWRMERIHKIKKAVDHMLCLFPFEPEIYHRHGIQATYIGHPLASQIPLNPTKNISNTSIANIKTTTMTNILTIAILPGSRNSEINSLANLFLQVACKLHNLYQYSHKIKFILPIANENIKAAIFKITSKYPQLNLSLSNSCTSALQECDMALVASGTATLEVALHKKPMIISYTVPWITAQIMKRQALLPYVGLPNILAGKIIVPEYLQNNATVEKLFNGMCELINNSNNIQINMVERFYAIHEILKRDTVNISVDVMQSYI